MNTLFYIFSSFQLLSGIMVIQSRNPVHSVLFLILVFFNAAPLLLLLGLDFFAMIFLVVYVGGIAVLFLFVVMMLNIKFAEISDLSTRSVKKRLHYLPIVGFLGLLFLLEMFLIVDNDLIPLVTAGDFCLNTGIVEKAGFTDRFIGLTDCSLLNSDNKKELSMITPTYLQWSHLIDTYTNIESIGLLMYTVYFVFFLLASLILLVAMIGAIVLTMHKTTLIKRQRMFQQNSREFAKTYKRYC